MKAKRKSDGKVIEVREWRGASDVVYSDPDMNRFYQASDLDFNEAASPTTPTARPQKPRECEHCTECGSPKTPICSKLYWNGTWGQDAACRLYRGDKHCPDFTPKKDKQ